MSQLKRKDKLMIALLGISVALMSSIDVGLMKYFTDVLGFNPAIFGRVLSVLAITTIFINILSGIITDKLSQYTRVIKISIPIIAILAASLLFMQRSWTDGVVFMVLLVIMIMYDFVKIIFLMNYLAYILNTATKTKDRTEISAYRNYLGFIPAAINSLVPVLMFTGGYSKEEITMVFLACVIVGFILSVLSLKGIRKDLVVGNEKEEVVTFGEMISTVKGVGRSRSFFTYFVTIFLVNGVAAVYYNMYLYYMENVMHAEGLQAALPDILGALVQFAVFAVAIKSVGKIGSRDTLKAGLIVTIVCYFGLIFAQNYILVTGLYAISMVGFAVFWVIQVPLLGTIIDLDELETGKRKSGTILALNSIVMSMGLNVMTAIFSFMLNFINYNGEVTEQAVDTLNGLRLTIGLIPVVFLTIGIIVISFMPINKEREQEIEQLIKEKHDENTNDKEIIESEDEGIEAEVTV